MLACPNPCGLHGIAYPPLPSHFFPSKLSNRFLFPRCSSVVTSRKCKFSSLSFLFSSKNRHRFSIRASVEPEVSDSVVSDTPQFAPQPYSVKIPVGDRHVSHLHFMLRYSELELNWGIFISDLCTSVCCFGLLVSISPLK